MVMTMAEKDLSLACQADL
jgi:hypothetical protein